MANLLKDLNEPQKQAVIAGDGPLLVVAGPGTGKTLTVVRRIAYLIQQGARPESIIAVTFTNRAAREMKERAEELLGRDAAGIFIGTFHLLGLRIIKESRSNDFVLLNREDQVDLLKSLMKCPARKAGETAEKISRIKNCLYTENPPVSPFYKGGLAEFPSSAKAALNYPTLAKGGEGGFEGNLNKILNAYQTELQKRNALDFDDLIRVPTELLEQSAVARKYQDRLRHIIVDEYQDINPAQCRLLMLLSGNAVTVCGVGDSDQAIYAFRGADLGNFLSFKKDFPGAARITLTDNYRSTGAIINASNSLIKNNQKRLEKEVAPVREKGAGLNVVSVPDERAEGEAIIREIEARMGGTSHYQLLQSAGRIEQGSDSCRFSDFAVIYRTNAQAAAIEEAFMESGIPYQVVGRKGGAQAREIEETIAYLRSFVRQDGDDAHCADDAQEAKLLTPSDYFDPRADAVALMTMHMAKGLEFKTVFITGFEEGLVPYTMGKNGADIEEERRLFYVGMTRAKDELFLLHARRRFLFGRRMEQAVSPFFREIPGDFVQYSAVPDRQRKKKPEDPQMGLFASGSDLS